MSARWIHAKACFATIPKVVYFVVPLLHAGRWIWEVVVIFSQILALRIKKRASCQEAVMEV